MSLGINLHSEEYKRKQSRNNKYLIELRNKATPAELKMIDVLDELGYDYIFQKGFFGAKYHCIVDFYLPKPYGLCIEVDGKYHNNVGQLIKDKRREKFLRYIRRFNLLRINNEYVLNEDLETIGALLDDVTSKCFGTAKTYTFKEKTKTQEQ